MSLTTALKTEVARWKDRREVGKMSEQDFVVAVASSVQLVATALGQESNTLVGALQAEGVLVTPLAERIRANISLTRDDTDGELTPPSPKRQRKSSTSITCFCVLKRDILRSILSYLTFNDMVGLNFVCREWTDHIQQDTSHLTLTSYSHEGYFNEVLRFSSNHLPNVKYFTLDAFSHQIISGYRSWAAPKEKDIEYLSGSRLNSALTHANRLKAVKIRFWSVDEENSSSIFEHARQFQFLNHHRKTLQQLEMKNVITYGEDLGASLRSLTELKSLSLSWDCFEWLIDGGHTMDYLAPAIKEMTKLQDLRLYCPVETLTDTLIVDILPHLSNLRRLDLGGYEAEALTDATLNAIATHCPGLLFLNISRNKHFSYLGVQRVLQSCPIQILFSYETILDECSGKMLTELLLASHTLVGIRCNPASKSERESLWEEELLDEEPKTPQKKMNEVTLACGGRKIVDDDKPPANLPDAVMKRYQESRKRWDRIVAEEERKQWMGNCLKEDRWSHFFGYT